jgi:hypothetical protein
LACSASNNAATSPKFGSNCWNMATLVLPSTAISSVFIIRGNAEAGSREAAMPLAVRS